MIHLAAVRNIYNVNSLQQAAVQQGRPASAVEQCLAVESLAAVQLT